MYEVHKLLWDIRRRDEVTERFRSQPGAVLDDYRIFGEWRNLITNFDVKSLYERGINPYLLYFCAIQLQVDRADYYARIRGER